MGLESVTNVADLNAAWPLTSDPRSQGDDHIRAIKVAVKSLLTNPTQMTGLTKAMVGLGNVDNTSDANKPVSTAVSNALAGYEPLNVNILRSSGSYADPAWITALAYAKLTGAPSIPTLPIFVDGEIPYLVTAETASLAYTPNPVGSLILVRNGAVLVPGATTAGRYTLVGNLITWATVVGGEVILAWYRR